MCARLRPVTISIKIIQITKELEQCYWYEQKFSRENNFSVNKTLTLFKDRFCYIACVVCGGCKVFTNLIF